MKASDLFQVLAPEPGGAPSPVLAGATLSSSAIRHQVRMLLHEIIAYSEMLREEAPHNNDEEAGTLLRAIVVEAKSTLSFANTVLAPATGLSERVLLNLREELEKCGTTILDRLAQMPARNGGGENTASLGDIRSLQTATQALLDLSKQIDVSLPSVATAIGGNPAPSPTNHQESTAAIRAQAQGLLLVVDDDERNRDILERRLKREGYQTLSAESGRQAIKMAAEHPFDLILLDIVMPEMDGLQVLETLKKDPHLQNIPVIMISALDEIQSVVRCIETGAEDFLPKPFNPVLLRARIGAIFERKRMRLEEQRKSEELKKAMIEVERERRLAEELLCNILPETVARELRVNGSVDPMYFEDVTIVFTDFVGFTLSTEKLAAEKLVQSLHEYFTEYDRIISRYGLEKLKTIGDSYMFAGGLPLRSSSHPVDAVLAAFELVAVTERLANLGSRTGWKLRIGVHTGPVIAGVVGIRKFAFDVWGDSVNFSSRMESSGAPNRVNISASTYSRVKDFFSCEPRGKIKIKDGRKVEMYFVNGVAPDLLEPCTSSLEAFERRYRIYFQRKPNSFPQLLLQQGPNLLAESSGPTVKEEE